MVATVWSPAAPVNGDFARYMAIEDLGNQYAATNVEDALQEIAGTFTGGAGGGASIIPGGVAGLSWNLASTSIAQQAIVANIIATQVPIITQSALADWAFGFDPGTAGSAWNKYAGNLWALKAGAVSWPGPLGSTLPAGSPIITCPILLGIPDGAFMAASNLWIAQKSAGVFRLLAGYTMAPTLAFPSSVVISF
jgi:hypothetical protein